MAKPVARIAALQFVLFVGGLALLGRAAYLQIVRGDELAARAEKQRTVPRELEAHRGSLYDRRETALAVSLESYRFGVAPKRVRPTARDSVIRFARTDLGIRTRELSEALAGKARYFYAHGPFTAGEVQRIRQIRGVELTPVYRREYLGGRLARPLIGALDPDSGQGASGLERFLDPLLRGEPGAAVLLKDARGRTYESPGRMVRAPVGGFDVILTVDRELQEIAEAALEQAFAELQPRRGDVVFLDPRTGELLAAASRESLAGTEAPSASFFVTSFEPGSTAKPFTAAALLELGRVDSTDTVTGENGEWDMPGRSRPIRDDHPQTGPITLARAVQVSSNIGMAKFASRLRPEEQYDMLRAFGFGTPTGIEFGAEAGGSVPRPNRWKAGQEGPSAAMGYAFEVTPIQLAAAYGAIANDGLLLAPSLIKEVRGPDGTVRYRHEPTVVRRVVSRDVAQRLREYLRLAAADSGTGRRAQVRGGVLGKTGTAKLVVNRVYTNRYAASFAGIYPAKDPQLVVVVRIEDPKSAEYYGGLVAAPITARMLRQALAVRNSPIDRSRLDDGVVVTERSRPAEQVGRPPTVSVPWPLEKSGDGPTEPALVPDVVGKSVREAAFALHRRGFRVRLDGSGRVVSTKPEGGAALALGRTVTVVGRRGAP